MSFYRSDSMSYYKLYLPRQSAWEIMNKLGQQDLVHIVPSTVPVLNRPFISQVKRCQEALSHLLHTEQLLLERKVYNPKQKVSKDELLQLEELWGLECSKNGSHPVNVLNDIIIEIEQQWAFYQDISKRQEALTSKLTHARDNLAVIRAGEMMFGRDFFTHRQQPGFQPPLRQGHHSSAMSFKCGVLALQDQLRFKKTVFRITKGNSFVCCLPFPQMLMGSQLEEQKRKVVFFVVYPDGGSRFLDRKLNKLVQNFGGGEYELPTSDDNYSSTLASVESNILQTHKLISLTEESLSQFLSGMIEPIGEGGNFRKCQYRRFYLLKEQQIYNNLNEMEFFNNFLQGSIYVRHHDVQSLQHTLLELEQRMKLPTGHLVPALAPRYPTHFVSNLATSTAQQIVETYGIADYKEANPSFFTVITFPFLFGVMFGDIGHGSLIFAFGLFLVFKHRQLERSALSVLLPHRYTLALMGFFSVYCGLIYNDFLSMALNLWGSCYPAAGFKTGSKIPRLENCVYPIGIDPVWSVSEDELKFVNSLKMKISVIIAVVHMTLGVFIKGTNTIYFRKYVDFFFEFIPQLCFLVLLFGYMDYLIIYKWLVNWSQRPLAPPSVITTMINLPLNFGGTEDCDNCGGQPMWGQRNNTSQDSLQVFLLVVSVLTIPLMLLPKPLFLIYCRGSQAALPEERELHNDSNRLIASFESSDSAQRGEKSSISERAQEAEASKDEIWVHQLIETIEYVLGCVSNTASYLRLWALSLAHSQLSEVFFSYMVEKSIIAGYLGIPLQIIGFMLLSGITFGVLLCMDSMECFLHTLRLHWVEFQNKFYHGSGFAFNPYSFSRAIQNRAPS